jgi:hypothetical protein
MALMLAELVLVSRLLGLVNGEFPVSVYVDPKVRKVELLRNGKPAATLKGAPWQTLINFGAELVPQELTAVAYDSAGNVIGRDSQLVNLPRPAAEAAIDLRRDGESFIANVQWKHIGEAKVRDVAWKVDGRSAGSGETSFRLPPLEARNLHVIGVEVKFWDGVVARSERVFGGQFNEEMPTELTAALVRTRDGSTDPAACFQLDGSSVPAAAVEKSEALVVFVRDPDPAGARKAFRGTSRDPRFRWALEDIDVRIMWPTATIVVDKSGRSAANLFEHSQLLDGRMGVHSLLTGRGGPRKNERRYADAVAVSGVYSAVGGRRRAVVLVIGKEKDTSKQEAAVVRRYLERIGVPLYVWSVIGKKPEVTNVWGEVVDVSSLPKLNQATEELRKELERQRVAWLPMQPLDALRISAAESCGLEPVAKP